MTAAPLRGETAFAAAALALFLGAAGPARADMVLTQAGADQGFTMTTFATGFPTGFGVGPLGIVFPAGGGVLVSDYPGNVRLFATDTDGQVAGPVAQNYGVGNAVGLAQAGGAIYMTQQQRGTLAQINPDGTLNRVVATGLSLATGIAANPANGHLLVSTSGGGAPATVYDVNPATGVKTAVISADLDGLTVSPDGSTLYGAGDTGITGYDLATGLKVFDSGPILGGVDGAALGTGVLAGELFVNTHDGSVVELNLTTGLQMLIASGGSRGDFVAVDPNGSLLLTQTDSVVRLTPPVGGGFGGGPTLVAGDPSVPEPSSLALLALGGAGLAAWRWKRRRGKVA